MDWKVEAIEKLRQYTAKRESLTIIPKQIAEVDSTLTSIRSAGITVGQSKGRSRSREDSLLDCIVQKEELQRSLERTRLWVENVSSGLAILNEEERLCLERFYIQSEKYAADRLAGDLGIEVKTVYTREDKALRKFTVALYGVTES